MLLLAFYVPTMELDVDGYAPMAWEDSTRFSSEASHLGIWEIPGSLGTRSLSVDKFDESVVSEYHR